MAGLNDLSKSQIDRLGHRLRKERPNETDLRLLNTYRRSFIDPYETVVGKIKDQLKLQPTGRTPKTATSILEKLRREHVRLSQMQDIAGCRIIVEDLTSQDQVVSQLRTLFDKLTIDDRRERPSHGYRAVHVIVDIGGMLVEIQVRTELQQAWAQLSEKLSDVFDRTIKYGGGNPKIASLLAITSELTMAADVAIVNKDIEQIPRLRQVLRELEVLVDDIPD
jgi:putative GTP pyrophosphokinase